MTVSSDVCSTEDAVQVFLQHLVDPLLSEKASVRDNPTPSQHQLIAKQVHSVVLLYNYYHRKQHPQLEYLPFNEFCKLIVVQRPPLLAYMKFMQKLNEVELIDVEKQLSVTEKVIMDACDICNCLDASKNVPNVQGWPITKVSILLIDSKKENCFLLFDSITSGVWSVVEKNVDTSSQNSELASETKNTNKRKRVIRKPANDEFKVDEDGLLQVGYSAIKEATGIDSTDIVLLESYTVYSQSKEKTASRFFLMQCSQSINQEVTKVPLKDVIESLQGPLVKKSSSSWKITPAVAYLHVLPYSEVISQCISRKEFSNGLQDSRVTQKNIMVDIPDVTESYIRNDLYSGIDSKPIEDNIEMQDQKDNNGSCTLGLCDSIKETHEMDVNKETREMDVNKSSIYPSQNNEKCQKINNTVQFGEDQEKKNPSVHCNSNGSANAIQAVKVDLPRMLINEGGINNIASCGKLGANRPNISHEKDTTTTYTQILNHSMSDREELQSLQDSKKIPSRTAISSLIRKRSELDQKENNGSCTLGLCDSIKETHEMDVNKFSIYPSQNKEKCQKISNTVQFGEDQEKKNPFVQYNSNGSAYAIQAVKVGSPRMLINEGRINNVASGGQLGANRPNISYEKDTTNACTQSLNHSNSDREELQSLQDSKKILSRTAISSLIRKRSELANQQRKIEDEIAICDTKLQRILTDGKDDFESMVECIVEGCNDVLVTNQEGTGGQQMSEVQSSIQDLDGVCHENNWVLPTYHVSSSDGGFQANVTVNGVKFKFSYEGNLCSTPLEARESAAAQMLSKLRSMEKSIK